MLKRKFHKMLSEGEGRQLLWLLIVTVASFIVFTSASTPSIGMAL